MTLAAEEAQGLDLFEGKAPCSACHASRPGPDRRPPLFTGFTYDDLGLPVVAFPKTLSDGYVPGGTPQLARPAFGSPVASGEVQGFGLLPASPNPFTAGTWIPFALPKAAHVWVRVCDVHGRLVRTLDPGRRAPGVFADRGTAVYWDGREERGAPVRSGVYFYISEAGTPRGSGRMVKLD